MTEELPPLLPTTNHQQLTTSHQPPTTIHQPPTTTLRGLSGDPRRCPECGPVSALGLDLTNVDLYCLECGYNLRGLSGDPRRCPECGHSNPVGEIEVPAPFITAQLARMETPPVVCVSMIMLACAAGSILLLYLAAAWNNGLEPAIVIILVVLLVVSPILWWINVRRFGDHCLHKPGWQAALRHYHISALGIIAIIVGVVAMEVAIYTSLMDFRELDLLNGAILLAGTCISGGVAIIGGRRAQRNVRNVLDPLQREVAVTMARERLRRILKKPH